MGSSLFSEVEGYFEIDSFLFSLFKKFEFNICQTLSFFQTCQYEYCSILNEYMQTWHRLLMVLLRPNVNF